MGSPAPVGAPAREGTEPLRASENRVRAARSTGEVPGPTSSDQLTHPARTVTPWAAHRRRRMVTTFP